MRGQGLPERCCDETWLCPTPHCLDPGSQDSSWTYPLPGLGSSWHSHPSAALSLSAGGTGSMWICPQSADYPPQQDLQCVFPWVEMGRGGHQAVKLSGFPRSKALALAHDCPSSPQQSPRSGRHWPGVSQALHTSVSSSAKWGDLRPPSQMCPEDRRS